MPGQEVSSRTGGNHQNVLAASIVVVDDEIDILTIMKHGLEHAGFKVNVFSTAKAALDHIGHDDKPRVDLVISDIRMPGINGLELARILRLAHPEIGIILMTAFDVDRKEIDNALPSTRIDGFIIKPFTISKLQSVVSDYLLVNSTHEGLNKKEGQST